MIKEKFRLPINIEPSDYKINIKDPMFGIGSCFIESIGNYLIENKFNIKINPFGNVFNPISIFNILNNSINKPKFNEDNYINKDGLFFNLDFHSSIYGNSKEELENKIINSYSIINKRLNISNILIITFGTSLVYKEKKTGKIIGNCHKLPADRFEKELLSIDKIVELFNKLFNDLFKINPNIKIILTVSPVRHIRDKLSTNSVSKSILRVVCNELATSNPIINYFPSFEILNDDLRDYRFYKEDMIHPNEIAEKYIRELFKETYFDDNTKLFINNWQKIKKNLNHRSLIPNSYQYQDFLKSTLKDIKIINNKYNINFSKEIQLLNLKLKKVNL